MKSTVNSRIKQLRTAMGLSQTDFATQCDLSGSIIAKIEGGDREPSRKVTEAICSTFGVDEAWILRNEGEMTFTKKKKDEPTYLATALRGYEESLTNLKSEVAFYRQLLTQMAGGKGNFRLPLSISGLLNGQSTRRPAA